MIISLRVVANAKKETLVKCDSYYKAYINAPALEGKANKALINLLSQTFGVNKSRIEIIRGLKSRDKKVQIDE
jgi:uncharacterized protein (TIGR00251 family)